MTLSAGISQCIVRDHCLSCGVEVMCCNIGKEHQPPERDFASRTGGMRSFHGERTYSSRERCGDREYTKICGSGSNRSWHAWVDSMVAGHTRSCVAHYCTSAECQAASHMRDDCQAREKTSLQTVHATVVTDPCLTYRQEHDAMYYLRF